MPEEPWPRRGNKKRTNNIIHIMEIKMRKNKRKMFKFQLNIKYDVKQKEFGYYKEWGGAGGKGGYSVGCSRGGVMAWELLGSGWFYHCMLMMPAPGRQRIQKSENQKIIIINVYCSRSTCSFLMLFRSFITVFFLFFSSPWHFCAFYYCFSRLDFFC